MWEFALQRGSWVCLSQKCVRLLVFWNINVVENVLAKHVAFGLCCCFEHLVSLLDELVGLR